MKRREGGFTLLETIIALGILAVGATTALALLVAAATSGRRAEHHVSSAIVADMMIAEVEAELNGAFVIDSKLEVLPSPARLADLPEGPIRAVTPVGDGQLPNGGKKSSAGSGGPAAPNGSTPRAFDQDPFAAAKTFALKKDVILPAFPDYKIDVSITPIGGPPDDPWEFLVEVTVKWLERGTARDGVYQAILLKKLTHLDNEAP